MDEWRTAHLVADEDNRFDAYDSTGTAVIAGATDATLVHLISKGYVRVRMP